MPNLDHDPQNPTDLLDRPIAAGDIVAWGTVWGKSPALCVAKIERIRFIRKDNSYGKAIEVEQAMATDYQLVLRPIKSTGDVTWVDKTGQDKYVRQSDVDADPTRYEAKTKTIQHVKNVVLLQPYTP